jgi:hypothetical protein
VIERLFVLELDIHRAQKSFVGSDPVVGGASVPVDSANNVVLGQDRVVAAPPFRVRVLEDRVCAYIDVLSYRRQDGRSELDRILH